MIRGSEDIPSFVNLSIFLTMETTMTGREAEVELQDGRWERGTPE